MTEKRTKKETEQQSDQEANESAPEGYVVDWAAMDAPGKTTGSRLTEGDIWEHGNKSERRDLLRHMSMRLSRLARDNHGDRYWLEWLSKAVREVSDGHDANVALRLATKKRLSEQKLRVYKYMIDDLQRQGLPQEKAIAAVVEAEAEVHGRETDPGGRDYERLKQAINRLRKRRMTD